MADEEFFEEVEEEYEEIEFSMCEGEIDEWISELTKLKEEREAIVLEIDEDISLKINYEKDEEEQEEEEDEEEENDDAEY